jgi:hypothetical protein
MLIPLPLAPLIFPLCFPGMLLAQINRREGPTRSFDPNAKNANSGKSALGTNDACLLKYRNQPVYLIGYSWDYRCEVTEE